MSKNASAVGLSSDKRKYIIIAAVSTLGLLALGYFLPERQPGNYLVPIMAACGMQIWYRKVQGDLIEKFPEAKRASWWTVVGLSLLVFVGLIALIFAFATVVVLTGSG